MKTTSPELAVPAPAGARPEVAVDAEDRAAGGAARSAARGPRPTVVRRRAGAALRWLVHTVWPLAFVLLAWSVWVEVGEIPPAVAPAPADVLAFVRENPAVLAGDAWDTVVIVAAGLVLGAAGGVALACVSWFSGLARAVISGPALITQCLPVATLAPVLARVLGYGTSTIVVITALISFFPVLVFTTAGLREAPPGADDVFATFGASRWQRFVRLAVPAAIPRVLIALRLSVVAAVVGAMLAQWIMGTDGLGYRLAIAQASFRTSEAWASSLVAILVSVSLYVLVAAATRRAQSRFE